MASQIIDDHGADGSLSRRDRFILSRLNATIEACESSLQTYAFAHVTSALHGFWLYDLCDRYIELIKPIMHVVTPENARRRLCTQKVLWTCLDVALRLSHPVMPFVTDELWQRLPGRHTMGEAASIMIAPYPIANAQWNDVAAEADFEVFKDVINAARSQRESYNLARNVKPMFYLRCNNADAKRYCGELSADFVTLASAASVTLLDADAPNPPGCAVSVVSDSVHVLLEVTGHCDFAAETAKLEKELGKIDGHIGTLQTKLDSPGYVNCKDSVKEQNAKKMTELLAKKSGVVNAISDFVKFANESKEEDCDDLFGDDDEEEEDEATVAARAAERKAKAAAAKAAKDAKKAAGKIQKTQCVFEIKPYEIETDLLALYENIKATVVHAEGAIQWGEACNLVPVAYGIKKLVCSVVIVDDLVCIDDIEEPINEIDDVQSIELCTMNRL
jgi:isoleucyl-tRNA synthetase